MRSLSPTICTSVWRLPRCQASCTSASGVRAATSTSGSACPATSTIAAIVEHDAVAVAQRDRLVEIQQELGAPLALEHDAAAMPVACIEHDEIDGGGRIPEARAANGPAALHACLGSAHNGAGKINRDNNHVEA